MRPVLTRREELGEREREREEERQTEREQTLITSFESQDPAVSDVQNI